jgi:hypothetical protein
MPQPYGRENHIERDPGSLEGHRLFVIRTAINSTLSALPNQSGFGDAVRDEQDRAALGYDTQSQYPPVENLLQHQAQQVPALGEVATTEVQPPAPAPEGFASQDSNVIPFRPAQQEDFPAIEERPAA